MRNDFVTLSHEPVGNSEQLLKIKAQLVKIKTQLLYFCKVFAKTGRICKRFALLLQGLYKIRQKLKFRRQIGRVFRKFVV